MTTSRSLLHDNAWKKLRKKCWNRFSNDKECIRGENIEEFVYTEFLWRPIYSQTRDIHSHAKSQARILFCIYHYKTLWKKFYVYGTIYYHVLFVLGAHLYLCFVWGFYELKLNFEIQSVLNRARKPGIMSLYHEIVLCCRVLFSMFYFIFPLKFLHEWQQEIAKETKGCHTVNKQIHSK